MGKQRYIDRMLETENLTDELEDSAANWLLDWGIAQLDRVLVLTAPPKTGTPGGEMAPGESITPDEGEAVNETDISNETRAEATGEKVNALMAVMRKINRTVGARRRKIGDLLAQDFQALSALVSDTFERDPVITPAECRSAAARLSAMDEEQAVQFMAQWALRSCNMQ